MEYKIKRRYCAGNDIVDSFCAVLIQIQFFIQKIVCNEIVHNN